MTTPDNGFGLTDEQAAKRRRYEEALDRFAGFEPGESQLSDEEIMARRAARQRGLSQRRGRAVPPAAHPGQTTSFESLVNRLLLYPGMAEHLEGMDLDGDGIPDIPIGPPPSDPGQFMRWRAAMTNRQTMLQAARSRRSIRKEHNNQLLLRHLRAHDPLFEQVQKKLQDFVRHLPERLRRPFLRAVEETPGAYLDLYREMRGVQQQSRRGADQVRTGYGTLPAGVRRNSQTARNEAQPEARRGGTPEAERLALVRRIKAGGARDGDLIRYMELSGF